MFVIYECKEITSVMLPLFQLFQSRHEAITRLLMFNHRTVKKSLKATGSQQIHVCSALKKTIFPSLAVCSYEE